MAPLSRLLPSLLCILALAHYTTATVTVTVGTSSNVTCSTKSGLHSVRTVPRITFTTTTRSQTTATTTSTVFTTTSGISTITTTIASPTTVPVICPTISTTTTTPAIQENVISRDKVSNKLAAAASHQAYPIRVKCLNRITLITTTLQVQTVTSTITTMPTVTISSVTSCASSFLIQATGGSAFDGAYAVLTHDSFIFEDVYYASLTSDSSLASAFNITSSMQLRGTQGSGQYFASEYDASLNFNGIYFLGPQDGGFLQSSCTITSNATILCSQADGRSKFEYCPQGSFDFPDGYIGLTSTTEDGCTEIQLVAIPVI